MPLHKTIATILTVCGATLSAAQTDGRRLPATTICETRVRMELGGMANPAMMTTLADTSISAIGACYDANGNIAETSEVGTGWRGWRAEGRTYIRMGRDLAAWGHASYKKGVRENVLLSENIDYETIRPMAVADSVGGDKDSENYAFAAGFAWDGRLASVGLQIGYSSTSEYRDHDPRPKADAVEAQVKLGGVMNIGDTHRIGLYGSLRKYSQDMTLKFFNAYKETMTIYHLQGLGTDYTRFSGVYDGSQYRGRGIGGGLTYSGPLRATIAMSRMRTEKSLDDLEDAVIGETLVRNIDARLSRDGQIGLWETAAILSATLSKNELTQHIYDDGTHNYHRLSSRKPYTRKTSNIDLTLHAIRTDETTRRGVETSLRLGLSTDEEKETDTHNSMRKSVANIVAEASAWQDWSKCRLTYGLRLNHRSAISTTKDLTTPRKVEMPHAREIMASDFDRQTTAKTGGAIDLRLDIDVPRHIRTFYISAHGSSSWYHNGDYSAVTTFSIGAGVTL